MKRCLVFLAVVFLSSTGVQAIPNSFFGNANGGAIPIIPAFPRFNADLTEEFFEEAKWKDGSFSGPWAEEPSMQNLVVRRMTANPIVMGEVPMTVVSYSDGSGEGSQITELAIHFLDAGLYFGYQAGGEQDRDARAAGRNRRTEFSRHFKYISKSVRERLEDGCGRGKPGAIGHSPALRTEFTEYRWEKFVLRFIEREDHSVSLHIYRSGYEPKALVETAWLDADRRERQALLEERVVAPATGPVRVEGLPMFTQGMTPFCGIHSLAMVGHYVGLRTSPEALAAAADFKNTGSAGGSDMIGVHRAVADELGMRVAINPKFDVKRVERSIQEGLPVIVWRRVSVAREKHHAKEAGRGETLPELSPEELEDLPEKDKKGSPSHASIVTGVDSGTGEIFYTEPWGQTGRDRRMRLEELEATAYAVFYFKL